MIQKITLFRLKHVTALTLLLWMTACASLPDDLQQSYSEGWQQPEQTLLGSVVAEVAPEDDSLSGVELVAEPDYAFRTRFALAGLAEKTLDLQYYLWKTDLAGGLLLWAALDAADRGVKVRFLIDDIYHGGRDDMYARLDAHPNFEVRVFNPMANRGKARLLNFLVNKKSLNHRMHNKIFLADSAVAVMGGRNIGNDYFGVDTKANFFDLDVLVTGVGAREAGAAFDEYWNSRFAVPIRVLNDRAFTMEQLEEGRQRLADFLEEKDAMPYAVPIESAETMAELRKWGERLAWVDAHVVVDPLERFEGQGESALVAFNMENITAARRKFIVESAYLIPSQRGLDALTEMNERGVRVRMLTNSLQSNNHITAHSGYLKYRKPLLRTGTELYELRPDAALRELFQANEDDDEVPAGVHTKAFVIDDEQTLIGSFNFDPRSRDLNSEIGLVVNDPAFAREVHEEMAQDFHPENSYRLFLDENERLRWELQNPDGSVTVYKRDPGAPWWRRAVARFLSWLPIEKEL